MRIAFAGTPQAAVPALSALLDSPHEVVGVLTAPDAPVGRRRRLTPSPVAQVAEDAGLPLLKTRRLGPDDQGAIAAWRPELGVVVAYGALLPDPVLAIPEGGWINLHFSLLPRWRGAAPVAAAILAGDDPVGYSVMRVVHDLDAGDVLIQVQRPRDPALTAGQLTQRFAADGASTLIDVIGRLAERPDLPGTPQTGDPAYASKLSRTAARVDWSRPADEIARRIQAMSPEPGAWCRWQDTDIRLLAAETAGIDPTPAPVGTVDVTGRDPLVRAADGWVRLLRVQPAGKRAMPARDWAHGLTAPTVFA